MSDFSFELSSGHTSGQVGSVLGAPIPAEISRDMYHGLDVVYDDLDETGRIQAGTRQSVELGAGKLSLVRAMIPDFPDRIAVSVVELSGTHRKDVFDDGQVVSGTLSRSVREESGKGVLIVSGEFTIGGGLESRWPSFLGDIGTAAVYYGIRKPNEIMLERLPEILAAA